MMKKTRIIQIFIDDVVHESYFAENKKYNVMSWCKSRIYRGVLTPIPIFTNSSELICNASELISHLPEQISNLSERIF